jgi:hypothetical protein
MLAFNHHSDRQTARIGWPMQSGETMDALPASTVVSPVNP